MVLLVSLSQVEVEYQFSFIIGVFIVILNNF